MSIVQRGSIEILNKFHIENMNYLNCKQWKVQKKCKKCYEKMKIFKFENTNPLCVLPNVFIFKCWKILYIKNEFLKL